MKRQTVYLYLHTHWDREWYLPFDSYRVLLLSTVRDVVEKLEAEELPSFLLDGQSCALEDVAEIDAALVPRIKTLMKQGKLSAGPWYVLADQMLVSGESLVRNLKLGLTVTKQFGPPALLGYCPDTFGHSRDLPRILNGFGIDNAFVWRGVPELDHGPVFWWQSQDGSRVLCYHLARGYYQAALNDAVDDEKLLQFFLGFARADGDNAAHRAYSHVLEGALAPVGADHLAPPDRFNRTISRARALLKKHWSEHADKEPLLKTVSLPEFSAVLQNAVSGSQSDLACLDDELRQNSAALAYERAYMLPGVLSTRLYLKRENRLAEHRLWRLSEPFYTYLAWANVFAYPAKELTYAARQLLRNQPHDSICGCSVDEVHKEMMQRTQSFYNLLDALDCRAAEALAQSKGAAASRFALGLQAVADPELKGETLIAFNTSSEGAIGPIPFQWALEKGNAEATPLLQDLDRTDVQITSRTIEPKIFTGFGQEPSVREVEVCEGWLWLDRIPPLVAKQCPWRIAAPGAKPARIKDFRKKHELVSVTERRLANEFLSVEIDPEGTLIVTKTDSRKHSRTFKLGHYFRDVADGGDTYNFDPVEGDRAIISRLTAVSIGQEGPLSGSLILSYEIAIPLKLEALHTKQADSDERPCTFRRSSDRIVHEVTTEVSLRRGVPIVFFETTWDNLAQDHRLEVVLDTGLSVETTFAENHFSIIERATPHVKTPLPVAKGTEAALDRLACQRFFIANGQLFLNQGLPEYAVDGSNVSITVLRAVSYLSRPRLRTRGGGAGPPVATPEANSFGENRVAYGWAPLSAAKHAGVRSEGGALLTDEQAVQAYRLAEQFEGPVRAVLGRDGADDIAAASLLQVDNPACRLTAMYVSDDGGMVFARFLNVTGSPQSCRLSVGSGFESVSICGLNEKLQKKLSSVKASKKASGDNTYGLTFGVNQLLTLALKFQSGQ